MTTYLDVLRERRRTPQAVAHLFRTTYKSGKYGLFVALEGEEDEWFYSQYVEIFKPGVNTLPLICDGKGGVLGLRDWALERYPELDGIYFFVDRDHDEIIGLDFSGPHTFITAGYSIENYFTDAEFVLGIFRHQFSLKRYDPLFEMMSDSYARAQRRFLARARTLMALVAELRRRNVDVDLDSIPFSDFFRFKDDEVQLQRLTAESLSDLLRSLDVKPSALRGLIKSAAAYRGAEDRKLVRGKTYLDFVCGYYRGACHAFRDRVKFTGRKLRPSGVLARSTLVHEWTGSLDAPEDLETFLVGMNTVPQF